MKPVFFALIVLLIGWAGCPSAQSQSDWHVVYDSQAPSRLIRLLPYPAGLRLRSVSHFDTLQQTDIPFVSPLENGSRIIDWSWGLEPGPAHFDWVDAQYQFYQRRSGTYWSLSIDEGPCGTPPHLYHFHESNPETGPAHYGQVVYRNHHNFEEEPCETGDAFGSYYPCIDSSQLWPGAWEAARAYVPAPNGRRCLALFDQVLVETDIELPGYTNGRVYEHLLDLRTSLIFDLATPDDSTLLLATSWGLIRCSLQGQLRDTLLAGTPIRRLRAIPDGWVAQTRTGLLRLDSQLNVRARIEPQTFWKLIDWTWLNIEMGGVALLTREEGARLLYFRPDLLTHHTTDLPAAFAQACCIGTLGTSLVLGGTGWLPAFEGGPALPFTWLATREGSSTAQEVALLELKAERVQRRASDFSFDLLARVANRSNRPLQTLGARANLPDHSQTRTRWHRLAAEPLLDAQATGWLRLGRFAAPFDGGEAPNELEARVCVQIELPNSQADAQPANNTLCHTLQLVYTSRNAPAESASLRLYPNPAHRPTVVESDGPGLTVQVIDAQGRNVWKGQTDQNQLELPTASWPPGIYGIEVTEPGGRRSLHRLLVP